MGCVVLGGVGGCDPARAGGGAPPPGLCRKSVHRSAKLASRIRFGALVYTVAPLWTGEGTQECTQIGENGLSGPFWGICVHCCDASCVEWYERLNHYGVSAAPPSVTTSRLVGKPGSARAAPSRG